MKVEKKCPKCKKTFAKRRALNDHLCTKAFESDAEFTRYHLRPIGTVVQLLAQKKDKNPNPDISAMDQDQDTDPNVTPKFSPLQLHELCSSGID